jgi:D-ribose pyranose/furanose isomerase RbsD
MVMMKAVRVLNVLLENILLNLGHMAHPVVCHAH